MDINKYQFICVFFSFFFGSRLLRHNTYISLDDFRPPKDTVLIPSHRLSLRNPKTNSLISLSRRRTIFPSTVETQPIKVPGFTAHAVEIGSQQHNSHNPRNFLAFALRKNKQTQDLGFPVLFLFFFSFFRSFSGKRQDLPPPPTRFFYVQKYEHTLPSILMKTKETPPPRFPECQIKSTQRQMVKLQLSRGSPFALHIVLIIINIIIITTRYLIYIYLYAYMCESALHLARIFPPRVVNLTFQRRLPTTKIHKRKYVDYTHTREKKTTLKIQRKKIRHIEGE